MAGAAGMSIHHRNGYEAIGAFLPPPEGRGLVFIDPPFEAPDEFATAKSLLQKGCARFPQATWAFWYPIKERAAIWRFHEDMTSTGIKDQLAIDFTTGLETREMKLIGSGLLLINPPYRLEDTLGGSLSRLHGLLAAGGEVTFSRLAEDG